MSPQHLQFRILLLKLSLLKTFLFEQAHLRVLINFIIFLYNSNIIFVFHFHIFCHFSPRLKRIIVLVYTHEVISTTIAEKTIQSRFNWHLNSCVENAKVFTEASNMANLNNLR